MGADLWYCTVNILARRKAPASTPLRKNYLCWQRQKKKPNKKSPARNIISAGNTLTESSYHSKQKHSLQYQNTVASFPFWCLPNASCKVFTLLLSCSAMWHEALYKVHTPRTSYRIPAFSSHQSLEIFLYLLPQEDSSLQWLPGRCLWFFLTSLENCSSKLAIGILV